MSEPSTVRSDSEVEQHVVVASDGSDAALDAATAAAALFEGARFEIVTVIPRPLQPADDATGFAGPALDHDQVASLNHERRVEGDGITAVTARQLGPRPADMRVLMGDPADALLSHLRDVRPDVLVVGASGHGRATGTVLGSVAWKLVAEACCSVLVVPRPTSGSDPSRPADASAVTSADS